jgi:hydrogenase nickel incorporation protein HypA/HybF
MHDSSIAQNLLEIIEETVIRNNAYRVTKAFVTIGELQAIEKDSLLFAFNALKEGTVASDADLIIETIPITGYCFDCKTINKYDTYIFSCKNCGSNNVELKTGEELKITEIEVD